METIESMKLTGRVTLTSNGDGAKTAKVTIVARGSDPVDFYLFGPLVHDFGGMSVKARIPLDWSHYSDDSIGYLNKFDTATGVLVCSGVIVMEGTYGDDNEDISVLVSKMEAGVPYEASIEHDLDDQTLLEFIPEGFTTNVNGVDIQGPVTVVRQWQLKAVAICKFGADSATSSELQFNKNKNADGKKGFFVRFAKSKAMGELSMSKESKDSAAPAVTTVETPVEAKAVEADAKVEEVKLSEPVSVEAVKAVETVVTETKDEAAKEPTLIGTVAVELSAKSVDPREEFKRFTATFGNEKAAVYFSAGLSYSDATVKFASEMKAENDDLKKRLSAIDRGATKPVQFRAEAQDKISFADLIKAKGN